MHHDGCADVRAGQVEMGGRGTLLVETLEQDADRQAGRGLEDVELGSAPASEAQSGNRALQKASSAS